MKIRNLFMSLSMLLAFGILTTSCGKDGEECVTIKMSKSEVEGEWIGRHSIDLSNQIIGLIQGIVNAGVPPTADSFLTADDIKFHDDTLIINADPTITIESLILELEFEPTLTTDSTRANINKEASSIELGNLEVKNAKIQGSATLDNCGTIKTNLRVSGNIDGVPIPLSSNVPVSGIFTKE